MIFLMHLTFSLYDTASPSSPSAKAWGTMGTRNVQHFVTEEGGFTRSAKQSQQMLL